MKKKYLSIVVVIFTIIAVWFMLANNTSYEDEYMMVQENSSKILKEELFSEIKNKEVQFNSSKSNYNIKNGENMKNEVKEDNKYKNNIIEKELNEKSENEKVEEENSIKEHNREIIREEEKNKAKEESLFKVDKNAILGQLTKEDKERLKSLVKKLSISDYASILYSIKNNGELECCLKITNILNRRLDETEYKMAKEILNPYINIEFLEEKLALK